MGEPFEQAETDPGLLSCSGSGKPLIATRNTTTSSWQLLLGVSAGTWDYVRGQQIAQNYDQFLAGTPLTSADREILDRYLPAVDHHHNLPTEPEGHFILHVHNFWYQVRHPGELRCIIRNALQSATGQCELGDRYSAYRGIKQMFIHSFRKNELKADLRQAVFARRMARSSVQSNLARGKSELAIRISACRMGHRLSIMVNLSL